MSDQITVSRSTLAASIVAELTEFFDDPRAGGSTLAEPDACWLAAGAISRALEGASHYGPRWAWDLSRPEAIEARRQGMVFYSE